MARQRKQEREQVEEPVEKLSRWQAVHKAIGEVDGDTTYSEIITRAQELLKASGEEDWDDYDATWKWVERACDSLEGLGLIEQEWEVRVHPTRSGKLGNGNGSK